MSVIGVLSQGLLGGSSSGETTLLEEQDVRAGTLYYYNDDPYTGTLTKDNYYDVLPAPTFDGVVVDLVSKFVPIVDLVSGLP